MGLITGMIIGGLWGYLASTVVIKICEIISPTVIQQQLRDDKALYALLKKVQPHSISLSEIKSNGDSEEKVLNSDEGVSNDLYVGQKIYA